MPAQMDAAHPAGFLEMRVGPFHQLAPLPQQPFPACASDPPVGWHTPRPARLPERRPVPSAAVRLRRRSCADERRSQTRPVVSLAVIPSCQRRPPRSPARQNASTCSAAVTSVSDQGRRVARTRVLHRHAHDGDSFQVRRACPRAVCAHDACGRTLILAIFASGSCGWVQSSFEPFLCAGPVEPGQLGARRRREAGRLGQPGQKCVVALARVPPHSCSAFHSALSLPASWHQCRPCAPPPAWRRPVAATPRVNTAWWVSRSIRRRVRDSVEWSGGASWRATSMKRANGSASRRRAMRSNVPSPDPQSSREDRSRKKPARRHTRPADPVRCRTTRPVPPRTHRTPPRRAPDSAARKTGDLSALRLIPLLGTHIVACRVRPPLVPIAIRDSVVLRDRSCRCRTFTTGC